MPDTKQKKAMGSVGGMSKRTSVSRGKASSKGGGSKMPDRMVSGGGKKDGQFEQTCGGMTKQGSF